MMWLIHDHIGPIYKAIADLALDMQSTRKDQKSDLSSYQVGIEHGPHIVVRCPPAMLDEAMAAASRELERLVKSLDLIESEEPYESGDGGKQGYA